MHDRSEMQNLVEDLGFGRKPFFHGQRVDRFNARWAWLSMRLSAVRCTQWFRRLTLKCNMVGDKISHLRDVRWRWIPNSPRARLGWSFVGSLSHFFGVHGFFFATKSSKWYHEKGRPRHRELASRHYMRWAWAGYLQEFFFSNVDRPALLQERDGSWEAASWWFAQNGDTYPWAVGSVLRIVLKITSSKSLKFNFNFNVSFAWWFSNMFENYAGNHAS